MMNTTNRVSAIFNDRAQAQQAVTALMGMGVNEQNMSIVAQQNQGGAGAGSGQAAANEAADAAGDVTKGTVAGMGVGALFGIAAALIPGVGPFITAGTLLTTALGAVGGGAVAGAVVGGTTGAISSTLARAGYNEHEANHYGSAVEAGGTLVVVDTTGLNDAGVRDVLRQYGGQSATV
ncbi:hypothetical protein B1R32_1114 [Abditibacterium utsteinense]|uniref:Heat induced stress protein YflT n=1 Tax=Abditibacterium utsteinense TaxID=1960156 RepID=A0A2S8SRK9_9BACT|nr:hypothetical protein [Abditibacterium utsteinense]PQV63443.1 hypothetical protein B1R32_1114 [Abditibacterium utsteinense]